MTDTDAIIGECKDFYADRLTNTPIDHGLIDYFLNDLPQIPLDLKDACNKPITKEEIFVAVKNMKSGKTPGSDGLPKEFSPSIY